MALENLLEVVRAANAECGNEIDDEVVQYILALVLKNPLPDDRGTAQSQIFEVVKTHYARKGSK